MRLRSVAMQHRMPFLVALGPQWHQWINGRVRYHTRAEIGWRHTRKVRPGVQIAANVALVV